MGKGMVRMVGIVGCRPRRALVIEYSAREALKNVERNSKGVSLLWLVCGSVCIFLLENKHYFLETVAQSFEMIFFGSNFANLRILTDLPSSLN